MPVQEDLFGSDIPASHVSMPTPVMGGAHLTPQQRRFNQLIAKVEKITRTLADRQQLADAHRVRHTALIEPLRQQQQALNRDMVLFLHARLQRKGWTRAQQRTMREIVCALAQPFILEGDQEMLAIHDQHSNDSFEALQKAALADAETLVEDMLGVSLDEKDGFASVEQLLREGLRQAQDRAEAEQRSRHEKKPGKPGARQQKADRAQQDAQTTLREVYRKLASALHPDREPDAAERARKSTLMSEVNTAYERRDLLVLLQLQMRTAQIDPHAIGQLAREKLEAMMSLLKDQAKSLENELFQTDQRIRMEFDMPWGSVISTSSLSTHLRRLQNDYQHDIDRMRQDVQRVGDDQALKRWLQEQREMMDETDLPDLLDLRIFG